MKAALYHNYGSPEVIKVMEIEKPSPKDNEVLVKIFATTVTSGDTRLRSSDFPFLFWLPARFIFGLFKPKKKILGHELAGVIEEVGKSVTRFKKGDEIFGTTTLLPTGSYAEYICLPEEWKHGVLELKPQNLSFQASAALPIGGMTALFLLEKAGISKSKNTLVYGASGSVGSYAVQIAKHLGSTVTGVCSTPNIPMVKSLGADKVMDYRHEEYTKINDEFDIVIDAVGKTNRADAKKVLKSGGKFVSVNMLTSEKKEHLLTLKDLAEKGVIKPFVDRHYPLDEIVSAHSYVDKGHKKGNVVIDVID